MKNIISTHSFDVFDTCISRAIDTPRNLFLVLGEKISPRDISTKEKIKTANAFMKARIAAEKEANAIRGRNRSAHFDEIYKALKLPKNINYPIESIAKMELELENELSYPIKQTLDKVNLARTKGLKIIFISDMYLDHKFIESLLRKHQFFIEGDALYVSSTYGETKRSGKLFNIVLKNEQILSNQILHHGDDVRADIRAADKNGIENILIDHRWKIIDHVIFNKNSTFASKYIFNSIPRQIQLEFDLELTDIEYKYFSLFAPLLLSFTLWVLEEAQKLHIECLYFLSRDGELPYKIARFFSMRYKNIEIKYLYGSRDAWLLTPTDIDKKNNFISYLSQEGLLSEKRWAIVDSGWAMNGQKALKKIVSESRDNITMNGFYFGISDKRVPLSDAGNGFSYSGSDFYFPKKALVIESLLFGSNKKKTIEYNNKTPCSPIFEEKETLDSSTQKYNDKLHSFVEKYAQITNTKAVNPITLINFKSNLLSQFRSILKNPDINFVLNNSAHLARKIKFLDLYKLTLSDKNTIQSIVWIEACGKLSGIAIYFFSRILNSINIKFIQTNYLLKKLLRCL